MSNLKKRILEAGLLKQSGLIADFRTRVKDAMANDGNVNEESYDNHVQTFQSEVLAEVNLLSDEIEFASQELSEMRKIDPDQPHDRVEYGAVVQTDQRTFFVSVSLEEFMVAGKPYFGISINSPVYQSMKGKKAGEPFLVHGKKYVIKAIY